MTVEDFLKNLSAICLQYINATDTDITKLARKCGVSRLELTQIINCNKQDIKISTVVKICENTNTPFHLVFCLDKCPLLEFMSKFPKDFKRVCDYY